MGDRADAAGGDIDNRLRLALVDLAEAADQLARRLHALASDGDADVRAPPVVSGVSTADLQVHVCGRFRVFAFGEEILSWPGPLVREVFQFLLCAGRPVGRDRLIDAFWPEGDPDAARRSLHQVIYEIRRTIRPPDGSIIRFADGCYGIDPGITVWLDAEELAAAVGRARQALADGDAEVAARHYAIAHHLHGDGFLPDGAYADWTDGHRREAAGMHEESLRALAAADEARGDLAGALRWWEQIVDLAVYDEGAYRSVARLYLTLGRHHLARAALLRCRTAIVDDLGVALSEETAALSARLGIS